MKTTRRSETSDCMKRICTLAAVQRIREILEITR
jgi:hypothetical protein